MKKGFTLIELLAVIVILAIIALIATPMILGVIESAKKGAAESSVLGYVEAVEHYYLANQLKEDPEYPTDILELNTLVKVKGEKPSSGKITLTSENYIEQGTFCMNHYYVVYDGKKAKVDSKKNCEEAEKPIVTPEYQDESGANKPILLDNMIPVIYDGTNWVKADKTKKWYDYEKQEWANAVTVSDESRSKYLSDEAGTAISMDDINTMWVWIPRYEYKIEGTYGKGGTSTTNPGEIEVNFIKEKGTEASSSYHIHPGFTFGDQELTGIWISKFEASATEISDTTAGDNVDTKTIIIKPNAHSWRYNQVAKAFTASRKMELAGNPYGFSQTGTEYNYDGSITNDSNNFDIHMLQNTEWGTAAYLSQSRYGKYGNPAYDVNHKEVYINNNSRYQTGCSAGVGATGYTPTCMYEYNVIENNAGVGASTTGTIYGIYDMNGGSQERVMGNFNHYIGGSATNNSGFNGLYGNGISNTTGIPFPDLKYYTYYTEITPTKACNGGICYGDNTTEAKQWYGDYYAYVNAGEPWVCRGGSSLNNTIAGVFSIVNYTGFANYDHSFRIALTIE